jgi:periplasmic copper chaperone A
MDFLIAHKYIANYRVFAGAIALFSSFFMVGMAAAQNVEVKDAWVRTTVPGQKATGAYMTLTAKDGARLVGVASPVAGVAEIHEMKMEGDVMKMRAVEGGLELPAGKPVELKSGSYHVMLMDLKSALPKDTTVPVALTFTDAKGVQSKLQLNLPVAATNPSTGKLNRPIIRPPAESQK